MKKPAIYIIALFATLVTPLAVLAQNVLPYTDPVISSVRGDERPFPDIATSLEGIAASELWRRGVISGYPDGSFRGQNPVNRAEAAKFLVLARYGENTNLTKSVTRFPDTPYDAWYDTYVMKALELGVISGHPDGLFRPEAQVNTAEFLKMLSLTFGIQQNLPSSYTDVPQNAWFEAYTGIAKEYGLFPRRPYSQLQPDRLMTRDDVALAIYQYLKRANGAGAVMGAVGVSSGSSCDNRPNVCSDSQTCIRDQCIDIKDYLPNNISESERYCKNDEVYKNGKCEKAKLNLVFYSGGLEKELFEDIIDEFIASFVHVTELDECKENIRYRTIYNLCLDEDKYPKVADLKKYFTDRYGESAEEIFIHPYEYDFDDGCITSDHSSYFGKDKSVGGMIHELGHSFGLADQYCYNSDPSIPNPVDFEEAQCREPEDDWHRKYCSRFNSTPYQCSGNFNEYGGRSIMGGAEAGYGTSGSGFGFSQLEIEHIQKQMGCK